MEIRDMVFTKEDEQKLIENRDAICKWIHENIISQLKKDDRIMVDYGGTYLGMRSYEKTTNYHIAVYGDKTSVYQSGYKEEGYIGVGEKYGGISRFLDENDCAYDIYPVIENWKYIRRTLLSEIKERNFKKKTIYDFDVED